MIEFIRQSTNPYPDWLKNHQVFEKLGRLDKIFPKLGLLNFKQEIEISNIDDATKLANQLWSRLSSVMHGKYNSVHSDYLISIESSGRERNERCNKLSRLSNLSNDFDHALSSFNPVKTVNNKVVLSLGRDVFDGGEDSAPIFRKGQSVFKCFADIDTKFREAGIPELNIEALLEYKSFNQSNIPNQKYMVHFSSTGSDGAWDIATASMRGIISCQKWDSAQSRGLIGSVASKYLAILYVVSQNEKTDYGQKMLHRCMVRLALHKTTLEPVLILDRMYPAPLTNFIIAFKDLLHQRSGLKVLDHNKQQDEIRTNYILLDEISRTFLKQGESSYLDSPMIIQANTSPIAKFKQQEAKTNNSSVDLLQTAQTEIIAKLTAEVEKRRAHYRKMVPEIETYQKERRKFEEEGRLDQFTLTPPAIESSFNDLRRGYITYKNTLNLLQWFENENREGSATKTFLNIIFKQFVSSSTSNFSISTKNRAYRYLLAQLAKNFSSIKDNAWSEIEKGDWMLSHGKSSKRFFETLLEELKTTLHQTWRDSI